ncbi:MAG: sigma-54-dependent Fis family transcriptional regulator [Pseudomonadota bacterium]|nr:sigma-54-dependent Fis family transcriptional regulator [Pseudomonadota bacterium]
MDKKTFAAPHCKDIIDLIPEPFVVINRDYQIVAANRQYRNKHAHSGEEIIGDTCYHVSHHSDVPCHENGEHCPLMSVFQHGRPTEVIHIHHDKDGNEEHVQLRAQPILDEDGKVQYMAESMICLDEADNPDHMLTGRSSAMMRLISLLQRVAPTRTTVLLTGESGAGKEKVSEYLHHFSNCHKGPFVVVDCSILGEQLIESELFGHEKGAFTGATDKKIGLIESAHEGTLFIDEISELPLPLQTRLLRFLETGTFRTVGGTKYKQVDVRVIAATNRNLQQMVADRKFRNDLYFRLTAFPIEIPPLRDRKDDIPALAEHFLSDLEGGTAHTPLSQAVIEELLKHDYPGNVRELRNIMERACILASTGAMTAEHLIFEQFTYINASSEIVKPPASVHSSDVDNFAYLSRSQGKHDTDNILNALKQCNGNRSRAADMLGVSERTIYRYVKKLRDEMKASSDE